MIQQLQRVQHNAQTPIKQATSSTNESFEAYLIGETVESDEITVDKYGDSWKYGMSIGKAEFGEYFTKEQIEEWRQSVDEVDAYYSAFLTFISFTEQPAGTMSMNYLDFRYLLEQGEVVNAENASFSDEIVKRNEWDFSVMLTETNGVRDTTKNKQTLDIIKEALNLGIFSKSDGLMRPEQIQELLAKQKYKQQQLLLARIFETKHAMEMRLVE